jgi:hypothetical protein
MAALLGAILWLASAMGATLAAPSPLPPPLTAVLGSMRGAAASALRHQWPTGQAKCDYHVLKGEWYDYEQIWHTGQLAAGLMAARRTLGDDDDNSTANGARRAGEWWVAQAVTQAGPTQGIVRSVDSREGGHGCITDACGPTEDLTDISDGSRGMFLLTNLTGDDVFADVATRSAYWQLKNMFVSGLDGMYYNVVNMTTGRHVTTPTMTMTARQSSSSSSTGSIDLIARSNIEGSLFLDACRHHGDQAMCDAFLSQADMTVARQDLHGLWMQWVPNDQTNDRFHPRFNTWYALSLLDAAEWLNDNKSDAKTKTSMYENAAIATARTMAQAQQISGTIYYWNVIVNGTSVPVPEKNAPCGSAVAVALQLWLRLYRRGHAEFVENIVRSVRWLLANQFSSSHPDTNLAGSYFELGFRKLAKWDSHNELDVVQRDLATNTGLQSLADYVDYCRSSAGATDAAVCHHDDDGTDRRD